MPGVCVCVCVCVTQFLYSIFSEGISKAEKCDDDDDDDDGGGGVMFGQT